MNFQIWWDWAKDTLLGRGEERVAEHAFKSGANAAIREAAKLVDDCFIIPEGLAEKIRNLAKKYNGLS